MELITSRLILATVVRNLALTASFVGGAMVCRLVLAWTGRDVTMIMR